MEYISYMRFRSLLFPVFTAFLLCSPVGGADLLKAAEIVPESREDVLSDYLKRADTVLLVCVYEVRFTPFPAGNGVLWDRDCQCRVVQSLRGKVPVGGLLNLHRKAENMPDSGTVRTEGSKRFLSSPVQGALWYVFLDSGKLKNMGNDQYEYALDTMWLNPLAWRDREGVMAFRKLVHVVDGHIAEESDAARLKGK